MPRLKGLLFDLGTTLLYFNGTWPEVFAKSDKELSTHLRSEGFDLDPTFMTAFRARLDAYYIQREAEFIEHTSAYILKTLLGDYGYPDVSEDILRPALKEMYAVSQKYWIPEEDARPTLEKLRQAGYQLGILSNASDDADVQTLVDKANIRDLIDFAISSAACGIRKPNPSIFEIAIKNWGFENSEVAIIGDTLGADILGGKNAGIFNIWITRRADNPGNRDHANTIIPDASIETLAQLPALLEKIA